MSFRRLMIAIGGAVATAQLYAAPAPVVIELSHQLAEDRAEQMEPLIASFNKQQPDVQVKLVRRVEGGAPKQINLVTNEEQAKFVAQKSQFTPLYAVMREAKMKADLGKLSPELKEGVTDSKGQLLALPVAYSTPVLYINKTAFKKAGLDPNRAPKTWFEAQEMAGKLADSGSACPFTTSWPAWILVDNMSAWNGGEVADSRGKLNFNGLLQIKHVAMMATWYKSKYFAYFGRRDEADRRFAEGECGMLTSTSSLSASLAEKKGLDFGVAPLPYYDDAYGAPKATLADGASLWVANGLKPAETKAVAKFVEYVLSPEVQVKLTLAGGFLPMTQTARAAANTKLLPNDVAGLKVAYAELQGKPAVSSVRVSQIDPVRVIVEEELEAVWANKKPAKSALDDAVARSNAVMATSKKIRM